jgi:hypothetical protein
MNGAKITKESFHHQGRGDREGLFTAKGTKLTKINAA